MIGTADDFLLTSFAAQGEMNAFLKERATARKNILSKFLNLQVFDSLNALAKESSSSIKSELRRTPALDLKASIETKASEETKLQDDIIVLEERKLAIDKHIKKIRAILERESPGSSHTLDDVKHHEDEINKITKKINQNKLDLENIIAEQEELKRKIDKAETMLESADIATLKKDIERAEKLSGKILEIEEKSRKESAVVQTLEKSVKKLNEVPCGDAFLTCKYIKDSHKDSEILPQKQKVFQEITTNLEELRKMFDADSLKSSKEKLERFSSIQLKLPGAKNTYSANETRVDSLQSLQDTLLNDLLRENKELQELRAANSLTVLEDVKKMQDEIEDCLDAFDEKYGIFAKILEKPIFFDSIEIRQVIQEIKSSQALLLRVANIIASPGGEKS
jgi:DNA repair exonuclease SbcCD ATPase subunit